MKVLNREKKIKDINPIKGGGSPIKKKEDLDNYVEEPLLEICRKLYDLNIRTIMSSANKQDIGDFAWVYIDYGTLSKENKESLQLLLSNFPNKFSFEENLRETGIDVMHVKMPITSPDTTAGEISDYFFDTLQCLKIQDITEGVVAKEDIKGKAARILCCKVEELSKEDFMEAIEFMGYEIEQDGKYYTKEAFRRHEVYVNSKAQESKKTDKENEIK